MYNLARFGFTEMMAVRASIRSLLADTPATISEGAERVVQFLYREMVDEHGRPACALVRMFKTHPYSGLNDELKKFARTIYPAAASHRDMRCLVLLATAGDENGWNDTRTSTGHRAIPLASEQLVEQAPMIAQLIREFGVSITDVVKPPTGLLLDSAHANFNVFYVPTALGSPYIVAQEEFVKAYGIRSVVGVGGMVASGDLFATILFSRVPISRETADSFKVLGLNLKLGFLPLISKPLFRD